MDLTAEETRLARLSVPELQREYAGLTGEAVRSRHRGYLTRRILWWLQARAYGGLSERARSLAAMLARDGDIRLTPPRRPAPLAHGVPKPRDTRLPRPGRTIEREFAGKLIRVTVLTDGFEYDGKRYRSLTAVAHAVTGGCTRILAASRIERICRRYRACHNQEAMSVTPNQIREVLRAAPFQPFRIHLADSRTLEVPHPEFVAIQPDGRWFIVVNPLRLGGYELVNLPLIVSLTVLPDPPASQQAA